MATKDNKEKKPKPKAGLNMELGRVTLSQKLIFAKNFALMLKSGLTVSEALEVLIKTLGSGRLKIVLNEILTSVRSGSSLSQAMTRYPKVFSGFFIGSVYAGENSGRLTQNFEVIADELGKEKELINKVKGALIYPIVVFSAAIILGIVLSFVVLPKIIPMFEGLKMKLPIATVILIKLAKFLKAYGQEAAIGLILAFFGTWFGLTRKRSRPFAHGLILRLPISSKISRNLNVSRFCRTLASMLSSGLNIIESLEVSGNTLSNWHYRRAIEQVRRGVDKGGKVSDYLVQYNFLFPDMMIRMIAVGEETGKLEETLFYLADSYESEVDEAAKNLSATIEPALLIIIGLAVGFLALSIITPVYNLTGSLAK
ncbi:MAG: type II secretion system F family protein [Patescibacteria group bacterium]|nr:type II secretion system F family protein [Patescibacteria group bacterium]